MKLDKRFVERVEGKIGMGHGAWDMVDPIELCSAVIACISRKQLASGLGKIKSERKAIASAENGKLGGRPRKAL